MLRKWQKQCVNKALLKYQVNQTNFLAMATPGAGKTRMAAHLASKLFDLDKIDLVVCFTPSISVTTSFKENLEKITTRRMNGCMGSAGQVLTYHNLSFLPESFWNNFENNRVFVIFDEIHHCGGHDLTLSNAWGEQILRKVRKKAAFTLALSGTPWRSDKLPIALAKYSGNPSRLECDYIYPLSQAIKDNVCRVPKIIAIDNNDIRLSSSSGDQKQFSSIRELLSNKDISYTDILKNESIISFLLNQAVQQLKIIRKENPNAAGLIVASSIDHAYWISNILTNQIDESSVLVTHTKPDSHDIIDGFEKSNVQWIISIGMVSEGTDIPRLQVCCNLSRIKTELYFRQVLGRILRRGKEAHYFSYLYMLAEETLLEYANGIENDLPDHLSIVDINQTPQSVVIDEVIDLDMNSGVDDYNENSGQSKNIIEVDLEVSEPTPHSFNEVFSNNNKVSLFGQFFEELITLQHNFQNDNP